MVISFLGLCLAIALLWFAIQYATLGPWWRRPRRAERRQSGGTRFLLGVLGAATVVGLLPTDENVGGTGLQLGAVTALVIAYAAAPRIFEPLAALIGFVVLVASLLGRSTGFPGDLTVFVLVAMLMGLLGLMRRR